MLEVFRERGIVGRDRLGELAFVAQPDAAFEVRARVIFERIDLRQHRIVDRRPSRTVAPMKLQLALGVVQASHIAVGEPERVVGRAELREQFARALLMRDRGLPVALQRRNPSESVFRFRLRRGCFRPAA